MGLPFDQFVDDFISKLGLKKASKGEYHGPCPNCGGEDRFWINKYNGELNHHCRKECSLAERTDALRVLGLIPPYTSPSVSKNTIRTELRSHIYEDENSKPVRKAIKYSDGSWTQLRFKGGEWLYGVKDTPNILYGLPRLLEDHTDNLVFVFEGEKDCELAWKYGLLATTNVGGAGNWKDELNKPLEGRTVCLVPDNDNAGSNHVTKVSKSLTEAGIQNFILWKYRENLPEKGDFSDWMASNNYQVDEFIGFAKNEENNPTLLPELRHSERPTKKLFTKLSEIDRTPPIPIIEDMVFAKSLVGITGASYAGKSFVALDMFLPVAVGSKYYDKQTSHGNVGLIIGEGCDGIIERCNAWCASKGFKQEDANIYITEQALNIRDPLKIDEIVKELKEVGQFQVIIIDTLSRNFGGGNENAPMDMGEFIMACDRLINDLNCCVVTVHHTGKAASAGARGHSSYFAALTTEIKVEALGNFDIVVKNTKQKDFREFETLQFVKVETGNSITLEPVIVSKGNQRSKLTGNEKLALNTFTEAYRDKLATHPDESACRVHLDEWRKIFRRRHTGDKVKSKDTAFLRARTSLVNRGILRAEDDYYTYGDKARDGDKW